MVSNKYIIFYCLFYSDPYLNSHFQNCQILVFANIEKYNSEFWLIWCSLIYQNWHFWPLERPKLQFWNNFIMPKSWFWSKLDFQNTPKSIFWKKLLPNSDIWWKFRKVFLVYQKLVDFTWIRLATLGNTDQAWNAISSSKAYQIEKMPECHRQL